LASLGLEQWTLVNNKLRDNPYSGSSQNLKIKLWGSRVEKHHWYWCWAPSNRIQYHHKSRLQESSIWLFWSR